MEINIKITERCIPDQKQLFLDSIKDLDKLFDHLKKNVEIFNVCPDKYYDPIASTTITRQSKKEDL